jgi:rubrerythrin
MHCKPKTKTDMEMCPMLVETRDRSNISKSKTLAHFLSSALHLEEQFSSSVYRDYLEIDDWPIHLKSDVFDEIRQRLTVLIEDSAKHEQVLHELNRKYSSDMSRDKRRIIREFELMEGFELSARDFYVRISSDPQLGDRQLREAFRNMSEAEQRHSEVVREIIDLLNNA